MANNNNGMITQNELSDSLNKKINDSDTNSKLNKQQIGSLPSLRTNSKDTLVNSINELFQYANNGKTSIANVIGIPVENNTSFMQLSESIQTCKNRMTECLSNKGVIKNSNESLLSLVNAINDITLESIGGANIQYGCIDEEAEVSRTEKDDGSYSYKYTLKLKFEPDFVCIFSPHQNDDEKYYDLVFRNERLMSTIIYNNKLPDKINRLEPETRSTVGMFDETSHGGGTYGGIFKLVNGDTLIYNDGCRYKVLYIAIKF